MDDIASIHTKFGIISGSSTRDLGMYSSCKKGKILDSLKIHWPTFLAFFHS